MSTSLVVATLTMLDAGCDYGWWQRHCTYPAYGTVCSVWGKGATNRRYFLKPPTVVSLPWLTHPPIAILNPCPGSLGGWPYIPLKCTSWPPPSPSPALLFDPYILHNSTNTSHNIHPIRQVLRIQQSTGVKGHKTSHPDPHFDLATPSNLEARQTEWWRGLFSKQPPLFLSPSLPSSLDFSPLSRHRALSVDIDDGLGDEQRGILRARTRRVRSGCGWID